MGRNISEKVQAMKGRLVVSCQALPDEPLHSSFIMGRMAKAAFEGGARGIRANTVEDIEEIRKNVDLPVIGIIKRDYPDSKVYITPTMDEIRRLAQAGVDIIALDATENLRPGGVDIDRFYQEIRAAYPDQLLMADCSTVEEALHADRLGFDFVGTTLVGYTEQSRGDRIEAEDFAIIREILSQVKNAKVIAEGNIDTCEKERRVIELGCYCVVIGSIITRPQVITRRFAAALEGLE